MFNEQFKGREEESEKALSPQDLLREYLAEELSEEAVKIRKGRESKEFIFSLSARIILSIAVLVVVGILYWQLFQIPGNWHELHKVHPAVLTAFVSGIIISTTALLGFLIAGVFRNADKDKPEHPMQNLLSNPGIARIFNLSVQAPLD